MNLFDEKHLTRGPSQVELVTLAVYLAGGDGRPIDTEDVAVKSHELAPTRFSWRKYPHQINLELVRVYLSAAKSPAKGGFIAGSGRTGWTLTPKGLKWAKTAAETLGGRELDRRREETGGGPRDEQRWRRERDRLLSTRAWQLWSGGAREVPLREAQDVFRIDSYAVGRLRELKVNRLVALFEHDVEITAFLGVMAKMVETGKTE
jgi:hypothetical protein